MNNKIKKNFFNTEVILWKQMNKMIQTRNKL